MGMIRVRTNRVTMFHTGEHEVVVTNLSDNSKIFCKNAIVIVGRNVRVSFEMNEMYADIIKDAVFFDHAQIITIKKILNLTLAFNKTETFKSISDEKNIQKIITFDTTQNMRFYFEQILSSQKEHDRIFSFLFFCKNFDIENLIYPLVLFSATTTFCNKVIDLIESDIANRWTLQMLSEEFNMSEIAIRKRLESEGVVFRELLIEIRMKKALSLLIKGEKTISQISREVGYNNISYFISYYKNFFGVTPKKLHILLKK